ncbi:MAG: L-seryl-tRNA(Sec) selenium transferase [Candidatus Zipacnadales bacterium]
MTKAAGKTVRRLLRGLPSVNDVLALEQLARAQREVGRALTVRAVRAALGHLREAITSGQQQELPSPDELAALVQQALATMKRPACRHVINGTGVIIHTGLGRSVLPESALHAIAQEARGYCLLEIDRETGKRGHRDTSVAALLCELTGAEAATVVNNNAAAIFLCLNTLAAGREVIVSRGQLVEIGGSFRIPDIMAHSGAILREVGTTNRTNLDDYEKAICEQTALLLRVHTSNFRMVGFTEQVPLERLVELGRRFRLPIMDDIGSGALVDLAAYGLTDEPSAPVSLRVGADIVCASTDKLVGACQGGFILGRADFIQAIRSNPLYRALRVDKLTLIVLEATLRLYRDPRTVMQANPTLRMITEPLDACARRASSIARAIRKAVPLAEVRVGSGKAQIGSGSAPEKTLPTKVIAVRIPGLTAEELARWLRLSEPPIFTRIHDDRVLIDAKTVLPEEISLVGAVFRALTLNSR